MRERTRTAGGGRLCCNAAGRALLVAAVVMGVGVGMAGCGPGRRSPERAVRALAEAAREGDVTEVMRLLGPRTRARLAEDARRAGEQAGRRTLSPDDLLALGWTSPEYVVEDLVQVERHGATAVVEVRGRHGERERVELVRERDGWKVELP